MTLFTYLETPCGSLEIQGNETAIVSISFQSPRFEQGAPSIPMQQLIEELQGYFAGHLVSFSVPLEIKGTPFQRAVWQELQKIPPGETRSYQEIAIKLGLPTAFRAVAQANRSNPFAIVIPCHRVIYKDGSLGGYAGGILQKKWLLALEQTL